VVETLLLVLAADLDGGFVGPGRSGRFLVVTFFFFLTELLAGALLLVSGAFGLSTKPEVGSGDALGGPSVAGSADESFERLKSLTRVCMSWSGVRPCFRHSRTKASHSG